MEGAEMRKRKSKKASLIRSGRNFHLLKSYCFGGERKSAIFQKMHHFPLYPSDFQYAPLKIHRSSSVGDPLCTRGRYSISTSESLDNCKVADMVAKNDANLTLSPTFRYVSYRHAIIVSNLSCRKFTKSCPSSDAKLTLKSPAKISGNNRPKSQAGSRVDPTGSSLDPQKSKEHHLHIHTLTNILPSPKKNKESWKATGIFAQCGPYPEAPGEIRGCCRVQDMTFGEYISTGLAWLLTRPAHSVATPEWMDPQP
ncbi:hypothetical protein TNCV_30951 [Trichonephila clavipes]|nr:hypothetical protein TNCV_30951 [Trichonephila clavipes]